MSKIDELFEENCNYEISMKCENGDGKGKIVGNTLSLMTGLSVLISNLIESGLTETEIKIAVSTGLDKKVKKKPKGLLDLLNDLEIR